MNTFARYPQFGLLHRLLNIICQGGPYSLFREIMQLFANNRRQSPNVIHKAEEARSKVSRIDQSKMATTGWVSPTVSGCRNTGNERGRFFQEHPFDQTITPNSCGYNNRLSYLSCAWYNLSRKKHQPCRCDF